VTQANFSPVTAVSRSFSRAAILLLLGFSLVVGGCSATRTVYNNLDWVVTWYLARHFDLDKEQKADLREMVVRNMDWHRRTQLPLYADYARDLADDLDQPVSPDIVRGRYIQLLDFWDASMLQIIPDTYLFLTNLTDEQVDQMIEEMEKNNQEMYDEYSGSTPEEREENRNRNTIKGIERIFGKLNEEQKQLVRDSLADMEDASEEWVENRRRWQSAYIELIREKPPEDEYKKRLTSLYVSPRGYDEPEFQARVDRNLERAVAMMSDLMNSLTPKQREKAQKRLRKYAVDFDRLAAQAEQAQTAVSEVG